MTRIINSIQRLKKENIKFIKENEKLKLTNQALTEKNIEMRTTNIVSRKIPDVTMEEMQEEFDRINSENGFY
jgi:regulator of replication initiation timing